MAKSVHYDIRMFRGLWFHSLDREGNHPWVRALCLSSPNSVARLEMSRLESTLNDEIHRHEPANAAEHLGLRNPYSASLVHCPAWATVLPWEPFTIAESIERQRKGRLIDTRQYGLDLPIDLGSEAFGPSAVEVVQICAKRLLHISARIHADGIHPKKGRVRAVCLEESYGFGVLKRRRFYVESGQHRAAIYGYLGLTEIPAKISRHVIARRDVASWPAVAKGYFSIDEADFVFGRMIG